MNYHVISYVMQILIELFQPLAYAIEPVVIYGQHLIGGVFQIRDIILDLRKDVFQIIYLCPGIDICIAGSFIDICIAGSFIDIRYLVKCQAIT